MNYRSRQVVRRCGLLRPLSLADRVWVLVHGPLLRQTTAIGPYPRSQSSARRDRRILQRCSVSRSGRSHSGPLWHHLLLFAVVIFFLTQTITSHAQKPVRRVLIFNDFGAISSGTAVLDQAIATGLEATPYHIELYNENIESTLFPDEASKQRINNWYSEKYSGRKLDLIITVGPNSLRYMLESHSRSFPNTPIVFCAATEEMLHHLKFDADFTGVFLVAQPENTLLAALKLQPRTRHVFVTGGVGSFDRDAEDFAKKSFRKYESKLEFTYLTELDMPSLLERLKHLPGDSIVYHTAMTQDAAGSRFADSSQAVPLIVGAANAPIFVTADVGLGRGTVGGDLISLEADGRATAAIAVKVLNGTKPQNIPIVKNNNVYMFDWRAMRRWGLNEEGLPPGSTILFRELSVWERTKWYWIGALFIILSLSALAIYLQFERKQLRIARDEQVQLSGLLINSQEKERSRLAAELHDDFSQRLALLALGLENAEEALPDFPRSAKQQLHELLNAASEIGADIHTVSHSLHSATLENLGLVPGIGALCKEFSDRHRIEIDFSSENISKGVHSDVALCLFRIVQEALQNFRKHSGAVKAEVRLRRIENKIIVSIRDEGKGFDATVNSKPGLGIRSMIERARLTGGHLEIYSEPGKGTRIEATAPFQLEADPSQ
jgi:signal transduction histidine kinase